MRRDPLRNFRFRLEIGGINEAHFSEATGFDTTTDAIDYREGDDPTHVRKLPGLTKYGNVTLKRGITDSMELYNWYKDVVAGKIRRQAVAIVVLDEEGKDEARIQNAEAWPSKHDPMDLNTKANDLALETTELDNKANKRTP